MGVAGEGCFQSRGTVQKASRLCNDTPGDARHV